MCQFNLKSSPKNDIKLLFIKKNSKFSVLYVLYVLYIFGKLKLILFKKYLFLVHVKVFQLLYTNE